MSSAPPDDLRPPQPSATRTGTAVWALAAVLAGAALYAWFRPGPAPQAALPLPAAMPAASVGLPASAPASAAHYPVAMPAASQVQASSSPASPTPDISTQLTQLLGRDAVLSLLQTDQFVQRLVATVDNLGRSHAPSARWPVNPSPGRFQVLEREGQITLNPDNGLRYTPLVILVETLPVRRSVALYVQLYPQLQQAYQDLGYPQGYFNDRLVEVIDLMLATPAAQADTRLLLTEVKGPIPATRPWVRYEFADPQWEALSAGQKILLRVGPVNQRRLKAKLQAFRQALVQLGTPR
jgi:hypothetical protein